MSRSQLVGPTIRQGHQPIPDYRLSLTQLDGVDCTIDSKMWEWERLDPLGSDLPGDRGDAGLSETDKVCYVCNLCMFLYVKLHGDLINVSHFWLFANFKPHNPANILISMTKQSSFSKRISSEQMKKIV